GASFASLTVSPGEIASAFGVNLGPTAGVTATATAGFLPKALAGVTVTFDGNAGPLFFTGNNQINVQVPFELAGKSSTTVQVTSNGGAGAPVTLVLRATDPGIFVSGGRAAILTTAGAQDTA